MQDLINKKFNKLTVIAYSHKKNSSHFWLCLCDCGNKCIVYQHHLKANKTKSCGCLHRKNSIYLSRLIKLIRKKESFLKERKEAFYNESKSKNTLVKSLKISGGV